MVYLEKHYNTNLVKLQIFYVIVGQSCHTNYPPTPKTLITLKIESFT